MEIIFGYFDISSYQQVTNATLLVLTIVRWWTLSLWYTVNKCCSNIPVIYCCVIYCFHKRQPKSEHAQDVCAYTTVTHRLIPLPIYGCWCFRCHICSHICIFPPVCFQSASRSGANPTYPLILPQLMPTHLSIIPATMPSCRAPCASVCLCVFCVSCLCQPVWFPRSQHPAPVSRFSELMLQSMYPWESSLCLAASIILSLSLSHTRWFTRDC